MKLYNNLYPELINVNCTESSTEELLSGLVRGLKSKNRISDEKFVYNKLIEREKLGSTSIGNHSAVPHTKLKEIKKPVIAIGVSKKGLIYHETDDQLVHLIILILSPNNSPVIHLQILAAAASLIKKSKDLIPEILTVETATDLMDIINKYENLDD
ncbi:MAG: PTS sugar transporter subunit IIA [Candidatus Aminicenantes bacterium]|nr:PTS sugar transporter subunit IIA [Candidatus Aminicenantes bacterium]